MVGFKIVWYGTRANLLIYVILICCIFFVVYITTLPVVFQFWDYLNLILYFGKDLNDLCIEHRSFLLFRNFSSRIRCKNRLSQLRGSWIFPKNSRKSSQHTSSYVYISYRIHRIFLGFFHRPVFQKTRRFGNWICFRPQVKVGEKTPTQLGPL
jgi:hypothetical protein